MKPANPGNCDVRRRQMPYIASPQKVLDPFGDKYIHRLQNRMIGAATGGTVEFDENGEVVLAVDPEKYAGV